MMNPFGKFKRETSNLFTNQPSLISVLFTTPAHSPEDGLSHRTTTPISRDGSAYNSSGNWTSCDVIVYSFIYLWHLTLKRWVLDLAHEGSQRWRWDCWKTKQAVSINLEGEQTAHKESPHACAVFTRYSFIVKSQKMRLGLSSRQKMLSSRIIFQEHCCCIEQTSRTDPAGPESMNTRLGVWFLLFIVGFH